MAEGPVADELHVYCVHKGTPARLSGPCRQSPLLSYSQRQTLPSWKDRKLANAMRSAARTSIQRSCAVIVARLNAHFKSEHNGQFHETLVIRLHATKCDRKTSSRGHCTCSFYSFSHRILDVLAGWQRKPVHSPAAFWSILQNTRGSKKVASVWADGWIL
jgi:hypothetical protein